MKWGWFILSVFFIIVFLSELLTKGTFNSLNALWVIVAFQGYEIMDLQGKIKD